MKGTCPKNLLRLDRPHTKSKHHNFQKQIETKLHPSNNTLGNLDNSIRSRFKFNKKHNSPALSPNKTHAMTIVITFCAYVPHELMCFSNELPALLCMSTVRSGATFETAHCNVRSISTVVPHDTRTLRCWC